jgi:hypothetical protein
MCGCRARLAEPGGRFGEAAGAAQIGEVTLADASRILQGEDSPTLVKMMLDWAKDDDRLRERLILYAARRAGADAGVATVRRAFENAVRAYDFVHYREAFGWARGVDDAIDSIEQLLNDGQARRSSYANRRSNRCWALSSR